MTKKLKEVLPFSAFPIRELVQELRKKGHSITLKTEFIVKDVYNSGDISGIICMIEEKNDEAIACGLIHLTISPKHPLFKEILCYQKKRSKRTNKITKTSTKKLNLVV